jgi:pimeloyl-ACP methyl ester carboxylesterase
VRAQVGDVSLWFEVYGQRYVPTPDGLVERPTVVLVHGGPGLDTGGAIRETAAALADFAQVVIFDQRGHGRSDYSNPENWNLDQWAADLKHFCDALGIDKPFVVGQSFGGWVTQVYAANYPDHPGGVVFLATSMRRDELATIKRFGELGGAEAADAWARLVREHSTEATDGWVQHCLPVMSATPGAADFLDAFRNCVLRTDAVDRHAGAIWDELDLRPHVEQIECPALVVGGDRDPVMPVALTRELADALGQRLWRLDLLPKCGHLVQRDQPERLRASIAEFVLAHCVRQPSQTPTGPQFA